MGYYQLAPLGYKNVDFDKKSNRNKVFKLFFRKVKEHIENTEIKANIDIFYELFRLILIQSFKDFFNLFKCPQEIFLFDDQWRSKAYHIIVGFFTKKPLRF